MRFLQLIFLSFTIIINSLYAEVTIFEGEHDFFLLNPPNTRVVNGNLEILGNSVMCYKINGVCQNDTGGYANNQIYLGYIDIDNNDSTYNSSAATLSLPPNSKVLWAAIFWQGYLHDHEDDPFTIESDSDVRNVVKQPIYIRKPNSNSYTPVYANEVFLVDRRPFQRWYEEYNIVYTYAAYSDITKIIQEGGTGQYIVANIPCIEGNSWQEAYDPLGNFGAWTIDVIYEDNDDNGTLHLKNISVYVGYREITDNPVSIVINGFYTPPTGPVKATLYNFIAEGDRYISGDRFMLNGYQLVEQNVNEQTNYFNSTITPGITHSPNILNNNGIDIHKIEVGQDGNTTHPQIIGNSENGAVVTFYTSGDHYFAEMLAFSVDLYTPKICYLETLYDKNGNELNETSIVKVGDEITTRITLRNANNEVAHDVYLLRSFESNVTDYVANSTFIKDLGYSSYVHVDDNSSLPGDNLQLIVDQGQNGDVNETNLTIGPFGIDSQDNAFPSWNANQPINYREANITYKFIPKTSGTLQNIYDTRYYFRILNYTTTLAIKLPQCTDFNNTYIIYEPNTGVINVTNPNFSGSQVSTDANSSQNALYTQVTGSTFNVQALYLKKPPSPNKPSVTLKKNYTLASLELIDAFNTSNCKSAPTLQVTQNTNKLVYFNHHETVATAFTAKKAAKGVRFRAKYFKWIDLMADHSVHCAHPKQFSSRFPGMPVCLTRNNDTELKVWKLKKIFGRTNPCFTNRLGNPCRPTGKGSRAPYNKHDGTDCLACLLDHSDQVSYSCSMDTFAIRPATYAIDVNETFLVGRKLYRLDINATNGSSNVNVLDYNITFASSNPDVNISTRLVTRPGCQGSSDANVTANLNGTSVTFADGIAQMNGYTFKDVGLVDINITDSAWTKIDQNKVDRNGNILNDCILNSSTNSPVGGKVGCMTEGSKQVEFHPKEFTHTVSLSNFLPTAQFTYLSNDPAMYALYTINVTARLNDGTAAQNYIASCYAKDVNSTLSLLNNRTLGWSDLNHRLIFFDDPNRYSLRGLTGNYVQAKNVIFDVKESNFTTGSVATIPLRFNIDRNVSIPDLPIVIRKNDFNLTTSEKPYSGVIKLVTGEDFGRAIDSNITLVYGRLDTNDELQNTITGNDGNVTLQYEIYNPMIVDAAGNLVPQVSMPIFAGMPRSPNSVNWIVNTNHTLAQGTINKILYKGTNVYKTGVGTVRVTQDTYAQGKHILKLHYNGNTFPYIAAMDVNASSWLIFNKFNQNAQTVPLHTKFIKAGNWMGVGSNIHNAGESNQSTINKYRINW